MKEAWDNLELPRGPVIIVAVGLFLCLVAAVLATDKTSGAAAQLEWVQHEPLPDSKPATVPGGGGQMRLTEGGIRATGTNVSGYTLYRVAAVLKIDAGSPVGGARILCETKAPAKTEIAQTSGSRASYPRSSEKLVSQEVPENVVVEFSSHGTYSALVELGDAIGEKFSTEPGIKLEWPPYKIGVERWEWFLPPGPPSMELRLPFASYWRTTALPSTNVSCTLTTSAGTTTVHTQGELTKLSPPIAE
ncbi:MAG: hypothetical protein WBL45_07605 [Solirubrobacterales bacterium]